MDAEDQEFYQKIPKINTQKMNDIIKQLFEGEKAFFESTARTSLFWICGRKDSFGFRPSFKNTFLPNIMKDWCTKLESGRVVITPIAFYACDQSNPENEEKLRHDGDDFLVYSHYNMLISYLNDKGEIYLERYEPANTHYQGNLNQLMEKLFVSTFGKYTKRDIKFNLISEKGLQNRYKDRTLCGHHILYWLIYRLKYGKDKAIEILNNPDTVSSSSFKKFCLCMTDSRVIKCSEGVA